MWILIGVLTVFVVFLVKRKVNLKEKKREREKCDGKKKDQGRV